MAFTDHKIAAFTHKISDLADQPNLPPDELKARFDSSPEELRQAHNALCDEANRLDERVGGIVAGTFGDTITEDMLSDELRETIDNAAAGSAVAEQIEAETAAREAADAALSSSVTSLQSSLNFKCQLHTAGYIGDGAASQEVYIGWKPRAVLVLQYGRYMMNGNNVLGGMILEDKPLRVDDTTCASLYSGGFRVYQNGNSQMNVSGAQYNFFALR